MIARDTTKYTQTTYDDMFGDFSTGIAGANQWLVKNVNDTLFPLPFLRNNSSDFFCIKTQSPHWRKQGSNIKPVHIHYILDAAYTGNQTIVFDLYYQWVIPNTVFPALTGWTQLLSQSVILSPTNLAQYYTGILSTNNVDIPPPSPESYGTGLLIRIVRGSGTYLGDLGILWADNHSPKDRTGSNNEYSD